MKQIIITVIISFSLMLVSAPGYAFESKYYGYHLCAYSQFKCIKVRHGDTWVRLFPDQRQREMVKRLNRTNIALRHRSWIVVPSNMDNISLKDLSPFPDQVEATGKKFVLVNLGLQAFAAYNKNGYLVHWGPVSGGRNWCSDIQKPCHTAIGSYFVIRKQGPECESSKFPIETDGGAPMPYCIHYYRGYALHGSTLPGYHASHGCIRLFYEDAKWLNQHFLDIRSKVIVTR